MSPSNTASFAIESLGREGHRLAQKSENTDGIDVCSHGIQKGILHQGWSTALIQLLKTRLVKVGAVLGEGSITLETTENWPEL